MAYSVRGKFQNQNRYSNRKYNQLLDLMRVQAEDTIEIEKQVNARLQKAANARDLGPLATIADTITALTPTKADDVVNKLIQGAVLDKRRSAAIGGIDTSNVQFLKAAANNADMEVRDLTRQLTEGMQFRNTVKDVGIKEAFSVIQESEAYKKTADKIKDKFDDIDFKGQFGTGGNVKDLLSLVKEGVGDIAKEYKEYYTDPGDYIKAVDKYKNPEKYRNTIGLLSQIALSKLVANDSSTDYSMFPFIFMPQNEDTETPETNIFSATNVNKKGS